MSIAKSANAVPRIILPGPTAGREGGTFHTDFVLWNRERTESRSLSGLVDTGASYTMVPAAILDCLGIERVRSITFTLADGFSQDLYTGTVYMELEGEIDLVQVIFGTDQHKILLGAMSLEVFGLAADAKNRRLILGELTL